MNDDTEQLDEQELQRLENALVNFLNTYYRYKHDNHTHPNGKTTYYVYLKSLDDIVDFVAQLYSEFGEGDASSILYEDWINNDVQLFTVIPHLNYDLGTKFRITLGTISWRK